MSLGPWANGPRPEFPHQPAYDTTPRVYSVTPNASRPAGGGTVTITGANFRNLPDGTPPTVEFGTDDLGYTAATAVVVSSSTVLTCTVPAGAADFLPVNIRVTIQGQSGTLFGCFTYYETEVFAVVPNSGTIAGGTTVLIEGANFEAGSTVTFGGSAATSVGFIDEQHITAVTPNHAVGAVDVVVTGASGSGTLLNGFRYTELVRGTDFRRSPGITIRDVLNNQPNTCTLMIDGRSAPPVVGEKITILDYTDSNRRLFAGNAQTVEQVFEDQTDQIAWNVTCVDFTWLFNRKRPFGTYSFVSVSDIVKDLVTKYAPGFTASHVQTNLARVSITLDGSKDMATVMNDLAQSIGGGHWYVDYDQDVHFFHVQPKTLPPTLPMGLGLGSYMTVASGGAIGTFFTYNEGYYAFQHTFVYSDGSESALQPLSNMIFLDGRTKIALTGIPTGSNPGSLTCTKRRIYYRFLGTSLIDAQNRRRSKFEELHRYVEIPDNTTTALTSNFGSETPSVATVTDIAATVPLPQVVTRHPPAPTGFGASGVFDGTQGIGKIEMKCALVYRDGSVSYPSNGSGVLGGGGGVPSSFNAALPIGATIASVDCIARFVYYAMGAFADPDTGLPSSSVITQNVSDGVLSSVTPTILDPDWSLFDWVSGVWVQPDNTTTGQLFHLDHTDSSDGLCGRAEKPFGNPNTPRFGTPDPTPIWPNPDGPSLETEDLSTLTDTDTNLLHEPGIKMTADASQVRNRVFVIGAGSTLSISAAVGDTQFFVNDPNSFSTAGGQIKIGNETYLYTSVDGTLQTDGSVLNTFINLATAIKTPYPQGTPLSNFYQADDLDAQRDMAKVLLDSTGAKTDGIIEGTVVDNTLTAQFQLFMRAYAELELFARPIIKVTYSTRDPKTTSGKTITIAMANPPISGDFLIQDVTIDQFHDESDQITPRYNVSASSVKFELTDLLLQILRAQQGPSGGSGGGNFAGVQAVVPATSTVVDYISDVWMAWLPNQGGTTQAIGASANPTNVGSVSSDGRSDGFYLNYATSAVLNNTASLNFVRAMASSQYNWTFECVVLICSANAGGSGSAVSPNIASALRIYVGLNTASPIPDGDGTTRRALMRFAPSLGDSGWTGITGDGTNRNVTARVAPIAYDTRYLITIRSVASAQTVFFSVNGGVEIPSAVNFPVEVSAGTPWGIPSFTIVNISGAANSGVSVSFKSAQMKLGSTSRP